MEKPCWFLLPKRIVDLVLPLAACGEAQPWQPRNFRACDVVHFSPRLRDGESARPGNKEHYYHVAIFNRIELEIVVDALAAGLAPTHLSRCWTTLLHQMMGREKASVLPLLKDVDIRELARVTVCSSLEWIGQFVARSWAIGLVLRHVPAARNVPLGGYLDVRVIGYARGQLHDLHVVALPCVHYHPTQVLVQEIEKVLDRIFPLWRLKVLGITHDGRPSDHQSSPATQGPEFALAAPVRPPCVYRTAEVVAALESSIHTSVPVIPHRVLHQTWGACQQLSQTLAFFYESLLEGQFVSTLQTLIACIQQNVVLVQGMGPPPSVVFANRDGTCAAVRGNLTLDVRTEWVAMGLDTQWITDKRVRLLKYLLNQQSTPSSAVSVGTITAVDDVWWVTFFVVHWVAARANEAFKKLQSPRIARLQQARILSEFFTELASTFVIRRDEPARPPELPSFSSRGQKFSILTRNVLEFLKDQGTFVSNVVAHVDQGALEDVLKNVAVSLVNLAEVVAELGAVPPESDTAKELRTPLPPVVPYDFAQLSGRDFTALLKRYEMHLSPFYPDEDVDALEQEFQAFHRAATHEPELRAALADTRDVAFPTAWAHTNGRFPLLEAFAGGLASAYAGRDSSTPRPHVTLPLGSTHEEGWRLTVADARLETTLHAQQFSALSKLSEGMERTGAAPNSSSRVYGSKRVMA
ncbi:hypothetical protein PsorP6_013894 [Peronosclerospora sorghi]|uniref:Uncharacterized protein n=1 Tax=Peronosclerospora sorghi TaxID=230839 RepID=A0ACC0VH05_9STRA|nr:hypothetical protein PsorP6_013894 [Peronosclerospora sorghi]